jgi:hypothetical protein
MKPRPPHPTRSRKPCSQASFQVPGIRSSLRPLHSRTRPALPREPGKRAAQSAAPQAPGGQQGSAPTMATLAESFLADLEDLSDDEDVKASEEEAEEQAQGDGDAEVGSSCGPGSCRARRSAWPCASATPWHWTRPPAAAQRPQRPRPARRWRSC